MKKIGIDARLYFQTGVGTYIQNLISHLEKLNIDDYLFYIYIMKEDAKKIETTHPHIIKRETTARWHGFKEQINLAGQLYADNLDLMHFTYFSAPIFYQRKFITTIHDITNVTFKTGKASTKNAHWYNFKHFVFKQILHNQVKNSVAIITPTYTTKNQIVDVFGKKYESKIFPIYEGINTQLIGSNVVLPKKYPKKYFLYIGNFYPHKNIERLIMAYKNIKTEIPLLLHGPKDFFSSRIHDLIRFHHLENNIILDDCYIKAEELSTLYQHAEALIFPSLSEGFGLPIVEAMEFNIPIIASNIPVFQELLNNNYLSFNPEDTNDITKKIESFISKPTRYDYKKQLSRFSFKEMTDEIFKLYKNYI